MKLRVLYHKVMAKYYSRKLSGAMDVLEEGEIIEVAQWHAKKAIELSDKTLPDPNMQEILELKVFG